MQDKEKTKQDELAYWKEQENQGFWLVNSIKFFDEPIIQFKNQYAPIDGCNSKYWLEHRGTAQDRSSFPYDLSHKKVMSLWLGEDHGGDIIPNYNRDGIERELLLLIRHDVDRNVDHKTFFGNPCRLHLVNLTEIFNFEPLFGKYLSSGRRWHWKGKQEVVFTPDTFDPDGALRVHPRKGELIFNSSNYKSSLLRRYEAIKERKVIKEPVCLHNDRKIHSGNSQDAPNVLISAKKNEVE